MKTSIIIPNINGAQHLADCIYSIRRHTHTDYEIIVVDDGSTDESLSFCRDNQVTFISLPNNKGYPAACNYGMKVASGEAILLLNNDVIVSPDWLDLMLACLYSNEQCGIVGPMSNAVSGKQLLPFPYTNIEETAQRLRAQYGRQWLETNRVVGLCMLMKREVMSRVGLLDEAYSPGYFEDDDYCYRARQAGFKLMIVQEAFIFHAGSKSFTKQGEERLQHLLNRNRQIFIDKWGVDPHVFI